MTQQFRNLVGWTFSWFFHLGRWTSDRVGRAPGQHVGTPKSKSTQSGLKPAVSPCTKVWAKLEALGCAREIAKCCGVCANVCYRLGKLFPSIANAMRTTPLSLFSTRDVLSSYLGADVTFSSSLFSALILSLMRWTGCLAGHLGTVHT